MKKTAILIGMILSVFFNGIVLAEQVCNYADEMVAHSTSTWESYSWPALEGPNYFKSGDHVSKPIFVGAEIWNNTSGKKSHTVICLYADANAPGKVFAVNMSMLFENLFPIPDFHKENYTCIPNWDCFCPKNSTNITSLSSAVSVFDCSFTFRDSWIV